MIRGAKRPRGEPWRCLTVVTISYLLPIGQCGFGSGCPAGVLWGRRQGG